MLLFTRAKSLQQSPVTAQRDFLKPAGGCYLIATVLQLMPLEVSALQSASAAERPNVVLCMTDDQGWGDTGYNGHPILKTPHLDAMASSGVRFDRFYATQHNCSPTRASLLTGRHGDRYRCYAWGHDLPLKEVTIAEIAQTQKYATGHFGKWHLGGIPNSEGGDGRGYSPTHDAAPRSPGQQGFQTWFSAGNWFDFNPRRGTLFRNGKPVGDLVGDTSDIVMDEALRFIRANAASKQPFLAVIWFPSPHAPYRAVDTDKAPYASCPDADFLGEVAAVDRAMGRLRAELKSLGIRDNTLLWFNSDNGAAGGTAGGLSGGKGTLLEGGVRVPGIIEWPARVRAPFRSSVPVSTLDIYPTICAVLGIRPENEDRLDGVNLLPLIDGKMSIRPKAIGFQASNTRTAQPIDAAWIDGNWKLLRLGRPQRLGPGNTGDSLAPGEYLFNLADDPTEFVDLKDQQADQFSKMRRSLDKWQLSVAASAAEYAFAIPPDPPQLVLGSKANFLLLDDPLHTGNLRKRWAANDDAGFDRRWDFAEGALRGRELPEDHHSAGCGTLLRHTDVAISVAVKLDGAQIANIKLDSHALGHIARLVIRPDRATVLLHGRRIDGKTEPSTDVITHDTAIKPGEWHTFVWEVRGDETALTMDGQLVGRGAHHNLRVTKDHFGFSVVGQSASFRDLRVWDCSERK